MLRKSLRADGKQDRFVVAITGTPGVGKSAYARSICRACRCTTLIELSEFAKRRKLFIGRDKFGSGIVNITKLESALKKYIAGRNGLILIVGHLAPELNMRFDIAIVLRADLKTLVKRLERRKYPKEKIKENLIAEAYDYCGNGVLDKAAEVFELETGKNGKSVIKYVCCRSNQSKAERPATVQMDKFGQLLEMINSGNKYGL